MEENFEIFCGMCPTTDFLPNEFDRIIASACSSTLFVGSGLHFNISPIKEFQFVYQSLYDRFY